MEKVKEEAGDTPEELAPNRKRMLALYGENKEIKTKDSLLAVLRERTNQRPMAVINIIEV